MEWKWNLVLSGVETEFCFEWSGNKILFRVEWKQNLVSSGNLFPFPDVFFCVPTHVPWLKLKDLAGVVHAYVDQKVMSLTSS